MLKIPTRAWLLAVLSGVLQVLVFPKFYFHFLSWVALVPLLYALVRGRGGEGELLDSEGRSLRPFTVKQGFMIAWASGVVWWFGTCYWVYPVFHGYGHLHPLVVVPIMMLLATQLSVNHGVFGALVVLMVRRSTLGNRRPLLLAPFFWTAIEFFRDRVLGVSWDPLGSTQAGNIPFTRIAEVTGVYGLSFAVVLVNCAFAAGLLLYGKRRRNLLISTAAAAIALQLGTLAQLAPSPAGRQALLVQANIPILDEPWTQDAVNRSIFELAQISAPAGQRNADGNPGLIVWPESPAPFFASDPGFQHWLAAIAQASNSYMIAGSLGETDGPRADRQLLNSALIITPQGAVLGRYDKIHLVPFGEYVPLRRLLFFAEKLTRDVGEFGRGSDRKVFNLHGVKAGVLICYETAFPGEVREFAANGAEVLVNISNDGWYGDTSAPFQHLEMARMRAIENHRWMLVDTNSGITVSIDPYGRIVSRAERNQRTTLMVPFGAVAETTFYTRYGDVFAWICVVISLAGAFLRLRIRAGAMIEARPA